MFDNIEKQAIVIIHGMGEQRPILTLRGFVEPIARYIRDVLKQARQNEDIFWEKPDAISGNYETRKMVMRKGQQLPSTHFYEFYWAHHMRDTKFSHLSEWLKRVVFRKPANVSTRLKPVFYLVWSLILIILISLIIAIFRFGFTTTFAKTAAVTTSFIGVLVLGYLSRILFNYLGDAARYLDPAPGNIAERQKIRAEGMALLKGLHESKQYDRIVIVSHSLGTAIAYDLIKLLWAEYYYLHDAPTFKSINAADLKKFTDQLNLGVDDAKKFGKQGTDDTAVHDSFRQGQRFNFEYLKAIGNPWRISDLVTIGSPLAHAGHLFAQEKDLFEKLKGQREYPTCPPVIQQPDPDWFREKKDIVHANNTTLRYFNHSSPFAATRWTNIYYNSDYVGGPVAPLFGPGIKDIPVKRPKGLFAVPGGHTTYWDFDNKRNILNHIWEILVP